MSIVKWLKETELNLKQKIVVCSGEQQVLYNYAEDDFIKALATSDIEIMKTRMRMLLCYESSLFFKKHQRRTNLVQWFLEEDQHISINDHWDYPGSGYKGKEKAAAYQTKLKTIVDQYDILKPASLLPLPKKRQEKKICMECIRFRSKIDAMDLAA